MISIDALILLGCLRCGGDKRDKAEVFHRVVNPEMTTMTLTDKDLKTALFFMVSIATILEEMTQEMMRQPTMGMNFRDYQLKIKKYKPTYDGMMDDFYDTVFGEFANRISHEDFITNLTASSWKYFEVPNLNEMFALMYDRYGATEAIEYELPQFEAEEDSEEFVEVIAPEYVTPSLSQQADDEEQPENRVHEARSGQDYFQVRKTDAEEEIVVLSSAAFDDQSEK